MGPEQLDPWNRKRVILSEAKDPPHSEESPGIVRGSFASLRMTHAYPKKSQCASTGFLRREKC